MQRNLARAGAGILSAAALALAPQEPAHASTIGVYFDAAASQCAATHPVSTGQIWYVFAHLSGSDPVAAGIAGAAFRITGVPSNWFHSAAHNPTLMDFPPATNPLQEGVEMSFVSCQTGVGGAVMLYSINTFVASQINNLIYGVEPPLLPSYTGYENPVLLACDSPTFTRICVAGTLGFVNGMICGDAPMPPEGVECPTVGIEPHTWGGLKKLYGD